MKKYYHWLDVARAIAMLAVLTNYIGYNYEDAEYYCSFINW